MQVKYNGDTQDIIKVIKHIMIDKDIRQKDICNYTGWSRSTVSNLFNGRTGSPGLDTILTLCKACDCDLYIDIKDKTTEE